LDILTTKILAFRNVSIVAIITLACNMVVNAIVTILMGLMVPISPQLVIAIATDLVVVIGPTVCIPCTREERNKMVTLVEAVLTVYMAVATVMENVFENVLSIMGALVIIPTTVEVIVALVESATLLENPTVANVSTIMIAFIIDAVVVYVGRNMPYDIITIVLIMMTVKAITAIKEDATMPKNTMVTDANTTMIVFINAAAGANVGSINPLMTERVATLILTAFRTAVAEASV
jgi:hypothetical protein